MQQNNQAMSIALSNSVLHRAKPEILFIIEHLTERLHDELMELLVEVSDYTFKFELLMYKNRSYNNKNIKTVILQGKTSNT